MYLNTIWNYVAPTVLLEIGEMVRGFYPRLYYFAFTRLFWNFSSYINLLLISQQNIGNNSNNLKMTKNAPFSWGNKEKFISLSQFYFLRSMKTIITLLLMLFAIPSVAQNTKCFKGEFIALNSPYVIYCTHSDSEEKEKNVHFWNSKTNQTDSLFSIEAKVWNDILYYCDDNTIKKRHLSKDNNKDSILLKTQYNI